MHLVLLSYSTNSHFQIFPNLQEDSYVEPKKMMLSESFGRLLHKAVPMNPPKQTFLANFRILHQKPYVP